MLRWPHHTDYDCSITEADIIRDRVIISIASHIDLNTLDALSLTCRQIRANLLQFRSQLITSTLHCENEDVELDPEHTFRYRARAADWYFVESGREAPGSVTGKVGNCARDMVGGCRRCERIVCRVSSASSTSMVGIANFVELHDKTARPSSPHSPPQANLQSMLTCPSLVPRGACSSHPHTCSLVFTASKVLRRDYQA